MPQFPIVGILTLETCIFKDLRNIKFFFSFKTSIYRDGESDSVVEHMPSMLSALGSIPSTTKNKYWGLNSGPTP
jgi:hypothetical protein